MTVIRASALSSYGDCPRRSAARIFRDEVEAAGFTLRDTPRGIGSTIGTAVHDGAAFTLREKMNAGALAPLSAATDAAVESYRAAAGEGVMFDQVTLSGRDAERQVVGMVAAYQRCIAPKVEPIMIEERLEADTGMGIILTGQGDLLAREEGGLRDTKTGRHRGSHRVQIGVYSMLYRSHGLPVKKAFEDFIRRVPASKPQPDPISFEHDLPGSETAAISMLRHVAGDIETFRNGDPSRRVQPGDPWSFPANPSSMLCSSKYCPAHSTNFCNEHKKDDNNE